MEDFKIEIKRSGFIKDFTIIYKGMKGQEQEQDQSKTESIEEIQTSKDELFRQLGYFKKRRNEIDRMDEIFIHDKYPIQIFCEFIQILETTEIGINERNYQYFYDLSLKYEFESLQKELEKYIKERPDINRIVDGYTNLDYKEERDEQKEELLSSHLDICLRNENMNKFPLFVLIRILNSPKRQLKDHRLLINFIKRQIETRPKEELTDDYIEQLFSTLDYSEMSNEELEELFHSQHYKGVTRKNHCEERLVVMVEERRAIMESLSAVEKRLESLEKQTESERNMSMQRNEEETKQLRKYEEMISDQKMQQEKIEKNFARLETQMNEQANKLHRYEEMISNLQQTIETQKVQFKQQIDAILQKQREEEERKQREEEEKRSKLEVKLSLNLQSDQTLKGNVNIIEHGPGLDRNRSKYILNTTSSCNLDEESFENGTLIKNLNEDISFAKPSGTYFLHAIVFDSRGRKDQFVSQGVSTNGSSCFKFGFTGRVQSATLEAGEYKLEVWGAEGGKTSTYSKTSGKGGYSVGTLKLNKRTTLYIYVGESPTTNKGGWNGGGSGEGPHSILGLPAGGGGSTDISLYGEAGSDKWNTNDHLYSRIIVAGAGGGSGHNDSRYLRYYGGYGGGETGQRSGYGQEGNGGTQNGSITNQQYSTGQGFGVGGTHIDYSASGGGSGWYGGAASNNDGCVTGGAGGSGYVYCSSTASNYPNGCKLDSSMYLSNASTLPGNSSFPTPNGSSTETGHSGHGYAKITIL